MIGIRGRRKIKSKDELLEEKIRQKEKAYLGEEDTEVEKKPEKKKYICSFCGEPFKNAQKLSWHIRKEHEGEKPPVEKEVKEVEEPAELSIEEAIYSFSGQAALLNNLKRFELTEAEAEAIDTGVKLITNLVGMYFSREENPVVKEENPNEKQQPSSPLG